MCFLKGSIVLINVKLFLGLFKPEDPRITEESRALWLRSYMEEKWRLMGRDPDNIPDVAMERLDVEMQMYEVVSFDWWEVSQSYICTINTLWPSDAILRHTSGSGMTCCLTAPSLYRNQCWQIISDKGRFRVMRCFKTYPHCFIADAARGHRHVCSGLCRKWPVPLPYASVSYPRAL